MKTRKVILAAWLILVAAASAFAQNPPPIQSNVLTQQLTLTPQVPITVNGITAAPSVQGSTTYFYWVVAHVGSEVSAPQGPAVITNGPATLSSSFFNSIQWQQTAGATSYDVIRSSSSVVPSGACNCAVIAGSAQLSAKDQSNSLSAYTVSTSADQIALVCLNTIGCPTAGTSGSVQVINVKSSPFNAPSNVIVDGTHISICNSTNGCGTCPFNGSNGQCVIGSVGEFSQADIGKTIWVNLPPNNIIAFHQGTINFVSSDGHFVAATSSNSAVNLSGLQGIAIGVWGNDDTPAITAAAAAAQASGLTVYFPCGLYMITGPALHQAANFNGAYSIAGAAQECVTFIPSPDISLTGVLANEGAVINFTAVRHDLSGITINGEGVQYSKLQANGNPLVNLQGRWQNISDFQIVDAATNSPPQLQVIDQDSVLSNVSVLNPTGGPSVSGDMCSFSGDIDVSVYGLFCSNGTGISTADLRIQNVTPAAAAFGLTFVGGLIDECGNLTTGSDGAKAACTVITNSTQVNFHGTIFYTGGNVNGGSAVSVDATSVVSFDGVDMGPFNTECNESQASFFINSGGIAKINNSNIRSAGGCVSTSAVVNNGTLDWGNGNTIQNTGGAGQFAGTTTPVFSATQSGAVTAGHIATWTGTNGQLQDGGAAVSGTILATFNVTQTGSQALTTNTFAAVPGLTQSVVFPAVCTVGTPCHVRISWRTYTTGGGSTINFSGGVIDGSGSGEIIAASQNASGGNTSSIGATQYSPLGYSGTVTFTVEVASNATSGASVTATPTNTPAGQSAPGYLTIEVLHP